MHLKKIILHSEKYPTKDFYPFNQEIFRKTREPSLWVSGHFFCGGKRNRQINTAQGHRAAVLHSHLA